jgi:hypothetical protein
VTLVAFYLVVVVLGILSMGFQLLASRLLSPHFGSDLIVWAWLISTFLAAFSSGSMLGGWISRFPPRRRMRAQLTMAVIGIVAFALTAIEGQPQRVIGVGPAHPFLSWLELATENHNLQLFAACMSLFFFPVTALSSFGPQCVQFLATRGTSPGAASGTVYAVSTVGNIAGVMLTALALIPHFRVSQLLTGWLIVAVVGLGCLIVILRSPFVAPSAP